MRKVALPISTPGTLLLHSMPGRFESWQDFVDAAGVEGVEQIVSLTSFSEIQEKAPGYATAIAHENVPFERVEVAIADYGVPADGQAFAATVQQAAESLNEGNTILVHCAAGIGRTGLFASCLLQALGLNTDEAVDRVQQAGSGAETPEQHAVVRNFSAH